MIGGVSCAIGAGMLWGISFVAPLVLRDFSPLEITVGRYSFFALSSLLLLAVLDQTAKAGLTPQLWVKALWLTFIGNVACYASVIAAIRLSGVVLPTLIVGIIPVSVAVAGNLYNQEITFKRLLPPTTVIFVGLILVHLAEGSHVTFAKFDVDYIVGLGFALCALSLWTWYAVANAAHLKSHPNLSPIVWTSMMGLATLPVLIVIVGLVAVLEYDAYAKPTERNFANFLLVTAIIGLLSSWVATWLWNRASSELPTALVGQLIVSETIATLLYAFVIEGRLPSVRALLGSTLLIAGVLWGIRNFREQSRPSII